MQVVAWFEWQVRRDQSRVDKIDQTGAAATGEAVGILVRLVADGQIGVSEPAADDGCRVAACLLGTRFRCGGSQANGARISASLPHHVFQPDLSYGRQVGYHFRNGFPLPIAFVRNASLERFSGLQNDPSARRAIV